MGVLLLIIAPPQFYLSRLIFYINSPFFSSSFVVAAFDCHMSVEMDSEDAIPIIDHKKRGIKEAMQPIQVEQTYMIGSLKSRQRRLRDIHGGLQDGATDTIDEPSLDSLNEEQLDVLRLAVDGCSLYITGQQVRDSSAEELHSLSPYRNGKDAPPLTHPASPVLQARLSS